MVLTQGESGNETIFSLKFGLIIGRGGGGR